MVASCLGCLAVTYGRRHARPTLWRVQLGATGVVLVAAAILLLVPDA